MFVITGKNSALANQVIEFMANIYPNLTEVDIEVIPTDLTEDNVFGWCLENNNQFEICLLYTSPSPRDRTRSRMPSSA